MLAHKPWLHAQGMAIGTNAVRALAVKATELEAREEKRKNKLKLEQLKARFTAEQMTGSVVGLLSAAAAGYVDGKFDVSGSDTIEGDGTRLLGVPIVPIVGAGVMVGGLAFDNPIANHAVYAGLSVLSGFVYQEAAKKGRG